LPALKQDRTTPSWGNSFFECPEQHRDVTCQWFAVYTIPRHEKRLAEHFDIRQIEFFLPLYRALRKWKDGSRVKLELPLFPNYIFVRISRRERVKVLEVPGVLSIIGRGREPIPLPDSEIEGLRRGLELTKIEPHPYLVVGEKVRINTGPLEGMEGVLIRKKNGFRVVLTISMIMKSVSVEVDVGDLEPIKPGFHPIPFPYLGSA
jgi:transcription antitermination factor NusG